MAVRKKSKKKTTKTKGPGKAKSGAAAKSGPASSMSVNTGHVFSLRPRVNSSYRQADFFKARLQLQDESYASIQEAARAVADKALELTRDDGEVRGTRHGR